MLRLMALATTAVLASMPRAAFGFPSSRLTYVRGAGAESCPNERAVRRAVAARLGYDPFFATADKTIVTRIVQNRDKLHATVELVDDAGIVRGIREFDAAADQCDELVATAALAISIAIDPTNPGISGPAVKPTAIEQEDPAPVTPAPDLASKATLSGAAESKPSDTPAATSNDTPPADAGAATPSAPPARASAEAPKLATGVAVVGALGTAPATAVGFAAFFGVRRGALSLAVEGRFDLPASAAMSEGGRIRASLWVASLVPCFHLDRFFLCALGSLGSLHAEGTGLATPRADNAIYAAVGTRLGLEAALSERFFLRPQVDVVGALFPAQMQVDGVTRWTAPTFAAFAGVGVGVRFP